jgi:hypothetical protein
MLALPNADSRRHTTVEQNRFSSTDDLQIHKAYTSKSRDDVRWRRVFGNVFVDVFVFARRISGSSPCLTKMTPNGENS